MLHAQKEKLMNKPKYWIENTGGAPCIVSARGRICAMEAGYQQTRDSDAIKVCAALNACAGIPDPAAALQQAREALTACVTEESAHCLQHQETPGAMARRLRTVNDIACQALAALGGAA
jgi:hypothetical protein